MINPMAVIAALDYKRRTGKGQYIDASMLEVSIHQVTPAFLDWQVNRHLQTRNGNRIPNASPHGVFPCEGEDRWCAIGVFTDEEWQSFGQVIGNPAWISDPRFTTFLARKENEDQLDRLVEAWTVTRLAEDVMWSMQAKGVAAGVVAKHILRRRGIEVVGYVKEAAGVRCPEMPLKESCAPSIMGPKAKILNIGSGKGLSIRDIIIALQSFIPFRYTFDASKPSGAPMRVLDITKAREMTGFIPSTDIKTGLKKTPKLYPAPHTIIRTRKLDKTMI
jgi:hypothetical protein